jgi:hypothetical protein
MPELRPLTPATRRAPWSLGFTALLFLSACGRTPLLPPMCLLQLDAQTVDFGEVPPGTSASKNIGFSNQGGETCWLAPPRLTDTSDPGFALGAFEPPALRIEPGHRSAIAVAFTPADGWPPLHRAGTLVLQSNDPSHRQLALPLAARILSTCKLSFSPTSVDFGHVALDATVSASVQIRNTGDGPCGVSGLAIAVGGDPQFALDVGQEAAFILAPGDQHEVMLAFRAVDPASPHHRTAMLTGQTTDAKNPTLAVPLSADIDVGCWLLISPASLDFGNVMLNNTASARVSLGNDGSTECQVANIALAAGTDASFTLAPGQPLSLTVQPGTQQNILVRFDAWDSAPPHLKTGTLAFDTGNPRAPAGSVPLSAYVNTVCVEASQWIYTIDRNGVLARFDPSMLTFTKIATLDCPGPGGTRDSHPNSMAVDQNAVAWVAYREGNLFKVDITTGKCEATSFQVRQHGLLHFGMGFVFDPTTGEDTLYIAGRESDSATTSTLATVSFPSLIVTPVGTIATGQPELSGTGDGQLWGFVPALDFFDWEASLTRFDPATGSSMESYTYPELASASTWAMKFWGGSFWIFLDTFVYHVPRDAKDHIEWVANYNSAQIVGAGVSSCAPVQQR